MLKHNRQSFWSIPFILLFLLLVNFLMARRIILLPGFGTFLIISLLASSAIIFWNNRYVSFWEETLHTFSNTYNGKVELIKVTERGEIVYYDAKGNYYGRAFHINTEGIRFQIDYQLMNVRLKIDSPIITSLKLKRKRWGKVDLDPLTIADVYDIQFAIQQQTSTIDSLYENHSASFRDEFINLADQLKIGVKLSILGKKYRDYLRTYPKNK